MRALPDDADVLARSYAAYAGNPGELVVTPDRIVFEYDDANGFVHVDADAVTAVSHASDPANRVDDYVGFGALAATAALAAFTFANPIAIVPAAIAGLAALYVAGKAFLSDPQALRIDADGTTYPFNYVSVDAAHDVRTAIHHQHEATDSGPAQ
ncbi:hypothetical protein [Halorubellus sp. PRR65]|uniref:hypothetical protein n=1 Tax=Halorubellus sp. PRR65 TaxID=3098148 RepID=UPI002B25C3F1|nr:hypothetical protein [Halorubellus sp. PRR65]